MKSLLRFFESVETAGSELASLVKRAFTSGNFSGEPVVKTYKVVDGQIVVSCEASVVLPPSEAVLQAIPSKELPAIFKSIPNLISQVSPSMITPDLVALMSASAKSAFHSQVARSLRDYSSDVLLSLMEGREADIPESAMAVFGNPKGIDDTIKSMVSGATPKIDDWGAGVVYVSFRVSGGKVKLDWSFPVSWKASKGKTLNIEKDIPFEPYVNISKSVVRSAKAVNALFAGDYLINLIDETPTEFRMQVGKLKAGTMGVTGVSFITSAYTETRESNDFTRPQIEALFKLV